MSESSEKRVYFTAAEKVQAIKQHLLNKEPVSTICNELGIHPNVFYEWQNKFFSEGEQVFSSSKEKKNLEKKVDNLKSAAIRKDTVIAELVTEIMDLKKTDGGK